jgi:hypothetical protein
MLDKTSLDARLNSAAIQITPSGTDCRQARANRRRRFARP